MTAVLIQEKIYVDYDKINNKKNAVDEYKAIVDTLYKKSSALKD